MDLDKQSLTSEQNETATGWETLFASFGWQLLLRRFEPRLDSSVGEMENAADQHALGRVQGQRIILREIVQLEGIIETEIRYAADQAEPQEVI